MKKKKAIIWKDTSVRLFIFCAGILFFLFVVIVFPILLTNHFFPVGPYCTEDLNISEKQVEVFINKKDYSKFTKNLFKIPWELDEYSLDFIMIPSENCSPMDSLLVFKNGDIKTYDDSSVKKVEDNIYQISNGRGHFTFLKSDIDVGAVLVWACKATNNNGYRICIQHDLSAWIIKLLIFVIFWFVFVSSMFTICSGIYKIMGLIHRKLKSKINKK